ncbi:MAG: hypothetical protein J6X49_13110, partial [Victivallales bacterium]|nr:hypothetical protein [Victivallales bacterium]
RTPWCLFIPFLRYLYRSLILRCPVSKELADAKNARRLVTPFNLHRLHGFASRSSVFFTERQHRNVLKQEFGLAERTHFVPILQETP